MATKQLDLKLRAPAKLNLMLHLVGRLPNGYHQLQTLFQFINVYDELSFKVTACGQINLTSNLTGLAAKDNLVMQAAQLLQPFLKKPALGIEIHLHKNLPLGAGLGAGSSNAAATLLALNKLWHLNLSLDELANLGLQLGADVPVFVRGTSAWAEGVGEILTPAQPPALDYALLYPGCSCSTAELFSHPDLPRQQKPISSHQAWSFLGSNAFTSLARQLNPPINQAFLWLESLKFKPYLTGSGSCIFTPLATLEQFQQLKNQLPATFGAAQPQLWQVTGSNQSASHKDLELLTKSVI